MRELQRLAAPTTIQAAIDPDEQARASTFQLEPEDLARLQYPYDEDNEQSSSLDEDPVHWNPFGPTGLRDATNPPPVIPPPSFPYTGLQPLRNDYDAYPPTSDGGSAEDTERYEGYTPYDDYDHYHLDVPNAYLPRLGPLVGRPRSASPLPRAIPRMIPRPRSQSPPWSLSHERQRASTVGARSFPVFPAPVSNLTAAASYGPTYEPNPRENALSDAILAGQQAIRDSDNGSWVQAARDEIEAENEARRARARRRLLFEAAARESSGLSSAGPSYPGYRSNASFNASTSSGPLGRPLGNSSTLPASAPATDEDEPSTMIPFLQRPNRRRRGLEDLLDVRGQVEEDGETTVARDVRRRLTTNGGSYRPVDGPLPAGVAPGVRMQRQRRSMPPLSAGANRTFSTFPMVPNEEQRQRQEGRDVRRDGIVWDVEDLDEVFDQFGRSHEHEDDQEQDQGLP